MATIGPICIARFTGTRQLVKVELVPAQDFTASATNYWVFTLVHRKPNPAGVTQTYGETVGSYSFATRTVTAGKAVSLYDDPLGRTVTDGESLWATAVSTGSPATPSPSPKFALTYQRKVR